MASISLLMIWQDPGAVEVEPRPTSWHHLTPTLVLYWQSAKMMPCASFKRSKRLGSAFRCIMADANDQFSTTFIIVPTWAPTAASTWRMPKATSFLNQDKHPYVTCTLHMRPPQSSIDRSWIFTHALCHRISHQIKPWHLKKLLHLCHLWSYHQAQWHDWPIMSQPHILLKSCAEVGKVKTQLPYPTQEPSESHDVPKPLLEQHAANAWPYDVRVAILLVTTTATLCTQWFTFLNHNMMQEHTILFLNINDSTLHWWRNLHQQSDHHSNNKLFIQYYLNQMQPLQWAQLPKPQHYT